MQKYGVCGICPKMTGVSDIVFYSKEQANQDMLERLCLSDRRMVEEQMNGTVIPALAAIGILPQDAGQLLFRFTAAEDTGKLWAMVRDIMPYKDIDSQWLADKFGIPVSDKTAVPSSGTAGTDERMSARIAAIVSGGDPGFFA